MATIDFSFALGDTVIIKGSSYHGTVVQLAKTADSEFIYVQYFDDQGQSCTTAFDPSNLD